MAMLNTARCACSRISITVSGEPAYHAVCHCTDCKRRTGSAFGVSFYFKPAQVVRQAGTTSIYAFHNQRQDNDQERHFCPTCGTTLFWYTSTLPDLVGIAGGCFGEEFPGEPRASYAHSKKLPWVGLPETWKMVHE